MSSLTHGSAMPDINGHEGRSVGHWPRHGAADAPGDAAVGSPDTDEITALGLRLAVLARAIEQEIIPRLMLTHRNPQACQTLPAFEERQIGARDVEEFAKLVLSPKEDVAHACVQALRQRGIAIETIYMDLLAPVARYLGSLWEQDLCDFTDVTVGLGRLQQVLRELSPAFGEPTAQPATGRRVLLLPSPGEQHTFGLVMVAEFFRRAGWDVAGGGWEAGADPQVMVWQEWFDVVGFSLGAETHLGELGDCIRGVRKAALNRQVGIMVGGPVFVEHPEYGALVEADAVARDGREAPELAEQLVASKSRLMATGARACQCHP